MTQYEKGQHAPNYQMLKRLSQVLDVPVPYFFCEGDTMAELLLELHKLDQQELESLLVQLKHGHVSGNESEDTSDS